MAVQNKYTSSKITGSTLNQLMTNQEAATGASGLWAAATFEIAAADDDTSVYRVFKGVNPNLIPISIGISCDTITAGTDWDLGLYRTDLGTVVDADCFMDGQTLATAAKLGVGALNGMAAVDVANVHWRIFEHAGHTVPTKLEAYDIALTANTVGSAAGTVTVVMNFAQG